MTTFNDSTLPRVGPYLRDLARPWHGRLALVGVAVLAAAVLDLSPPLIIRHVVDGLTEGLEQNLPAIAALYLAAVAAVQVLTAGYGYLASFVAQRALATLRTRLFAHLLALPTDYHDRTPTGDAVARATADVETIDDLFSGSVAVLLGETVRLVTVTVAMVVLSPTLTLAVAVVLPPLALLTGYLRKRIRSAERALRVAVGDTTSQLHEDLAGVEVIRAFGRQPEFAQRFRRTLLRWLAANNRSTRYNALYAPGLAVLSGLATAALLWLGGGGLAHAAGVGIGTLTAFVLLFGRFFSPLINLGDEWQNVQAALAGAERVFTVLAQPVAPPRPPGAATTVSGLAIAVDAVSFAYQVGSPVLVDVSIAVAPGELVAIVGRSGAGKTTILALLAGLYRPTSGAVRLAGHDPATLSEEDRRRLLGVVPQSLQLFTGTVWDNVALGDRDTGARMITQACQLAGAEGFIRALPNGYDTVLSDIGRGDGVVLSAGERQMLALARALVHQPRAVLLDEATSVIDAAGEAALRKALREHVLPGGTGILTVAHRLATARDADRVVVLSAGRVVEQGRPTDLLASDSAFAALVAVEEAGWDWEEITSR